MTINKTPGVYVIEKSIFPPSVAQVATAIPAFIGYTEKAEERVPGDLTLKPKKIDSLLEYRQYFGGAPPLNIDKVELDSNNALKDATIDPQYFLFDSLQLFFLNGGGECYIISVGKYGQSIIFGNRSSLNPPADPAGLDVGLAMLEKEDEPTIIVFPDAVKLSNESEFYTLQKKALDQCNKLGDRVAVFDLREYDSSGKFDWKNQKDNFRDNIGTSYLKYGVAYSPHLKTSLPKQITYRDFRNNSLVTNRFVQSGSPISLLALLAGQQISQKDKDTITGIINNLEEAADDRDIIENEYSGKNSNAAIANTAPDDTLLNRATNYGFAGNAQSNVGDVIAFLHNQAATNASTETALRNYLDYLYEIVIYIDGWLYDTTSSIHLSSDYQTLAQTNSKTTFLAIVTRVVAFDKGANSFTLGSFNRFVATGEGTPNVRSRIPTTHHTNYTPIDFTDATPGPAANLTAFTGTNDTERRRNCLPELRNIANDLLAVAESLVSTASDRYNSLENSLIDQFPVYKNLVEQLNQVLSTIPPSGAIAGVYAQVDANRGVWKAPANVSLNGVADLTVKFTESDTDNLNVDTNFGKSVNALKFMTGMGFMVWGARTLAGNDNEWRYVSVRRFFNMVEESVKKSTMWAVFEPNDKGTWVKVKGMIENFLTLQWRNGALQGAKPDESFTVKVGLGETMTPLDILEGRMIVEISMAVVRPAEFILLVFSHQMVQS